MRGGEAFQVADLEHAVAGRRQGGEVVRLGQGGGDRLFHQHVLAGAQGSGGERMVCLGRGGDDQRVAGASRAGKSMSGAPASQPTVRARSVSMSWMPTSRARGEAAAFNAW